MMRTEKRGSFRENEYGLITEIRNLTLRGANNLQCPLKLVEESDA